MESFFDFYDLLKSTNHITDLYKEEYNDKSCRFCGLSFPVVSFDTVPHIVPELFGRNNVTSNFECDSCNKKFQKYESDTSTMIQHYNTLLNIKTKKGVPVFQSKKNKYEFSTTLKSSNNDERQLNFGSNRKDYEIDENRKTLTAKFRTRKFSPYSVYKVFLKMGISLLSEDEIKTNNHFLDFLNSEEPIMNGLQVWSAFRYMLKTKYYLKPKVNLYKAKQLLINGVEFPEYAILINFANIIFQFFLPISKENIATHKKENELRLELFPSFILDDITKLKIIDMFIFELNETAKISITDKVVLHYKEHIRSSDR